MPNKSLVCKCVRRPALVTNPRDQFHLPQLKRASGNVGVVSGMVGCK